ncbi:hypothetical protein D3C84_418570 [compost metagenome]
MLTKAFQRRIALEIPRCTTTNAATLLRRQVFWPVVGNHQLDRVDPLQFRQQVFPAFDFQHREVTAGDVQHGQAEQALIAEYRGDQVIATLVQQRLVADGAGGNDAHHLTIHRTFAGRRVADLLTDHHRLTEFDQLRQVAFGGVVWNPAHRNRLPGRLPTGGQGNVQQLGGLLRVFVEDLVEVTHAVEHQLIRVLVLQAPVLLHHRGVGGQIGKCFIHQVIRRFHSKGWGKSGASARLFRDGRKVTMGRSGRPRDERYGMVFCR